MRPARASISLSLLPLVVAIAVAGCGGGEGGLPEGDPIRGAKLADEIVRPTCSTCHSLAAAGWEGRTAPDLDQRALGYQRIVEAVTEGPGAMPSYTDQLDDSEIHDIAAYVSAEAGQ